MRPARRLGNVPPFIFAELDKTKRELISQGVDLIDLGVGDPDLPAVATAVERLIQEAPNPAHHRYPAYEGAARFRESICSYYGRRFGVRLDPNREAVSLIGSKEGLSHLIWAFVDPGDYVLIPDPAFPVYLNQTMLTGGVPYAMPLLLENDFLPDLDAIPDAIARKAKLMFLNYPNNPTAAAATREFFAEAVEFATRNDILICHDACYVEMTYDGYVAPSILETPGARECAVEMYSWSKPFNMTGWRIGAMVGAAEAVRALGVIKTNTDSGQFTAIQMAAVEALENRPELFISRMNAIYQRRRDMLVAGLNRAGLHPSLPRGSFYVWCPAPAGLDAAAFTDLLLRQAHVMVVPGTGYGQVGNRYVRFALTIDEGRLAEAIDRIASVLGSHLPGGALMDILLHGCNGRMGGVMTRIIADTDGAAIACGVDSRMAPADGSRRTYPVHRSFATVTERVDVVIDFSHAWCLGPLVGYCVSRRIPLVSGTTGLTDEDRLLLNHASEIIPVLSAPNMSLGVSVVKSLARAAAAVLGRQFDIEIIERHHNQKTDAPSGTALALADAICHGCGEELEYQYGRQPNSGKRRAGEIGIHSLRGGSIVGEHSVIFAGPGETIEISHSALSRDLFGHGALLAARFVVGRKPGLYSIEDLVSQADRDPQVTAS